MKRRMRFVSVPAIVMLVLSLCPIARSIAGEQLYVLTEENRDRLVNFFIYQDMEDPKALTLPRPSPQLRAKITAPETAAILVAIDDVTGKVTRCMFRTNCDLLCYDFKVTAEDGAILYGLLASSSKPVHQIAKIGCYLNEAKRERGENRTAAIQNAEKATGSLLTSAREVGDKALEYLVADSLGGMVAGDVELLSDNTPALRYTYDNLRERMPRIARFVFEVDRVPTVSISSAMEERLGINLGQYKETPQVSPPLRGLVIRVGTEDAGRVLVYNDQGMFVVRRRDLEVRPGWQWKSIRPSE